MNAFQLLQITRPCTLLQRDIFLLQGVRHRSRFRGRRPPSSHPRIRRSPISAHSPLTVLTKCLPSTMMCYRRANRLRLRLSVSDAGQSLLSRLSTNLRHHDPLNAWSVDRSVNLQISEITTEVCCPEDGGRSKRGSHARSEEGTRQDLMYFSLTAQRCSPSNPVAPRPKLGGDVESGTVWVPLPPTLTWT